MAACLAAVEAEEALLQIYALQWRAIDLRAQQLRAECRRVALDEEIDREERELLREHEQLLRMREKQLAQEKYEDAFALRAEVRKLRRQSDALQQRQEAVVAGPIKRKKKAKGTQHSDQTSSSSSSSADPVGTTTKPTKATTAKKKSVAFSPRMLSAAAPSARPRRLDEELEAEAGGATKSAADELMQMLSQDRGSESEGDGVSLANLLPTFASGGRSPSRAESTAGGTPSKFTPSKLARSVVKKAMAAPVEFDFTRKAALAKAKAVKEKQQKAAGGGGSEDDDGASSDADAPTEAETPSKKALKRRKDLGISFVDRPVATSKTPVAAQSGGVKSLMQMIGVASLAVKPKEKSSAASAPPSAAAKKEPAESATANQKKDKLTKAKAATHPTESEGEAFVGLATANITKRAKPKKPAGENASTAVGTTDDEDAAVAAAADKPFAKAKAQKKDKANAVEQAIAKASLLTRMTALQDIETPKVAGKKTKAVLKKPAVTSLAAKRAEFQKILRDGREEAAATAKDSDDDDDDAEPEPDAFATPQKPQVMKRKRAEDASAPAQAPPPQPSYLQSPSVSALLAMRPSKSPIGIRYVPKTLKTPQMVRKRPRTTGQQDGSEPVGDAASAEVAPPRATVRPQRPVPTAAARGGLGGVAGALAAAGGSAWGSSGPSFFDKFVNDGGLRLKRTVKP